MIAVSKSQSNHQIDLIVLNVLILFCESSYGFLLFAQSSSCDESIAVSILAGFIFGLGYWHPYRSAGFPLIIFIIIAFIDLWQALQVESNTTLACIHAFLIGFTLVRLVIAVRVFSAVTKRSVTLKFFLIGYMIVSVHWIHSRASHWNPNPMIFAWILFSQDAFAALIAWCFLFRPAFELAIEPILWLMYPIRAAGPGLKAFPGSRPCLIIANHACWFDPIFLAKVFPRPTTAMMTSKFFDLPILKLLFRRLFHAIRVPDATFRSDAPELREAIAALDRGECVIIFPEGYLRRSEDRPLKRFGRGVWQILCARPETPVIACWIEGGWGSYTSYLNGKPTKGKRIDFRRKIRIGFDVPKTVGPELLANHLDTRIALMNRVAQARLFLDLGELPLYDLPDRSEESQTE